MHSVLAAAPFPAARFEPITPRIFNIAISCHYVISFYRSNSSKPFRVPNVETARSEYRLFRASRGNTCAHSSSAGQAAFAFSLTPRAFLLTLHYVFTAQKGCVPNAQARTSLQPYWRPSVLPHQEALLYCCHIRYQSQLSPRAKLCFIARSEPCPTQAHTSTPSNLRSFFPICQIFIRLFSRREVSLPTM